MLDYIKSLTAERCISGDEGSIRKLIINILRSFPQRVDPLGNLLVKNSGFPPANKVAVFAHMDEVGLLITHVLDNGLLKFVPIGIDPAALFGRRVVIGENKTTGVIGAKVWHHLEKSEREAALKADNLFIDIGASSKEEALQAVNLGDGATFEEQLVQFGDGLLMSRALDNRVGCAILLELLRNNTTYEFTAAFTCGEESSLFGATVAANSIAPDIAVILETTTSGDVDGAPSDKVVCALNKGPVVSFADRGTLYDRELYALAMETAKENGIPVQTKEGVYGGNEARAVSRSGAGVRTIAISVPCRYLHSSSCVVSMQDVENTSKLVRALMPRLAML